MNDASKSLPERLASLKSDLERQGAGVAEMVGEAVEAVFARDEGLARRVVDRDEEVDREDVLIEKRAVRLLQDAVAGGSGGLGEHEIRLVLTIVKVNNELERIADLALNVAEQVGAVKTMPEGPPARFRVMANSVIGMVETTNAAFASSDVESARLVLASDDATEAFKLAILREIEGACAAGAQSPDSAFALHRMASALARIGDHCTNIAEQIIYVETGKIVRHTEEHWSAPEEPG